MCSAPSSSGRQFCGVTSEKLPHGGGTRACRKIPPLRRTTRSKSESASMGPPLEFPVSRARHPACASFVRGGPLDISAVDKWPGSGVRPELGSERYDAGEGHENAFQHDGAATKRRNPAQSTDRQAAVL